MDSVSAFRSPDGRIRTAIYKRNGNRFCIAEATSRGALITEFAENCQVVSQRYVKDADYTKELGAHLDGYSLSVVDVQKYNAVEMKARCSRCSSTPLVRELDKFQPVRIGDVPVVPIFLCTKCGQRHYCLTDEYLRSLVTSNKELFEEKEREELDGDPDATISTIKEYIIRIFASKKISRAKIE